jgi:uncharacterized membrane protein
MSNEQELSKKNKKKIRRYLFIKKLHYIILAILLIFAPIVGLIILLLTDLETLEMIIPYLSIIVVPWLILKVFILNFCPFCQHKFYLEGFRALPSKCNRCGEDLTKKSKYYSEED